MNNDKLVVFDTTLRDGEQSPGASMTREEKVRIGKALERLGVDVIEAGFPVASQGDFDSVRAVAEAVTDSTVCGLSRANEKDILRCAEAIKPANSGRIHTFIATSPIHMKHKLRMQPDEVVSQAIKAVKLARQHTDNVEFSAEDAGRTELDFLCRIVEAAIDAGATTINIPDTVGYTLPHQFANIIQVLLNTVPNADKAIFSVHCHNDLGLAVANSLAAVDAGARQVECTINGLGERAGNASLEELVMAVKTRQDQFTCNTSIVTEHIVPTSRLVSSISGFPVQPNKAIVGANAFAHESGIHQDGILKARETYEIMKAEDVGWSSNALVLGKHSGRAAFKARLTELGIDVVDQSALDEAFIRFKALADKKHEIFDEDLQSLFANTENQAEGFYIDLLAIDVKSGIGVTPTAEIELKIGDKTKRAEAHGGGVVDASFSAIEKLVNSGATLQLYSVNAITSGSDSQGDVTARLEKEGRVVNGQGADTDIVVASAKAYINALNKLMKDDKLHPQTLSDGV